MNPNTKIVFMDLLANIDRDVLVLVATRAGLERRFIKESRDPRVFVSNLVEVLVAHKIFDTFFTNILHEEPQLRLVLEPPTTNTEPNQDLENTESGLTQLSKFLCDRFSLEELKLFVSEFDSNLSSQWQQVGTRAFVAHELVEVLNRQGLISRRFFRALISARPLFQQQVDAIEQLVKS